MNKIIAPTITAAKFAKRITENKAPTIKPIVKNNNIDKKKIIGSIQHLLSLLLSQLIHTCGSKKSTSYFYLLWYTLLYVIGWLFVNQKVSNFLVLTHLFCLFYTILNKIHSYDNES